MLGAGFGQALRKANNDRLGKNKAKNDSRRDSIKRNYNRGKLRDDKLSPEEFELFKKKIQEKKKKELITTVIITTAVIIVLSLIFYLFFFEKY